MKKQFSNLYIDNKGKLIVKGNTGFFYYIKTIFSFRNTNDYRDILFSGKQKKK